MDIGFVNENWIFGFKMDKKMDYLVNEFGFRYK